MSQATELERQRRKRRVDRALEAGRLLRREDALAILAQVRSRRLRREKALKGGGA